MNDFQTFLTEGFLPNSHHRAAENSLNQGSYHGDRAFEAENRGEHELAHIHHTLASAHYALAAHHFKKAKASEDDIMNAQVGAGHHGEEAEAIHKKHGVSLYCRVWR